MIVSGPGAAPVLRRPAMSASPPTTLGKYQIIREIARSNDIVYEGYDPLMNRRVAIKELALPGGSTDVQREDRVRRFQREVKAAGSLAHPNIVTIYEVSEDAGRHYMAMEYLDGHTLRNELDTKGFLPVVRSVEIAQEVLSALEFAHRNGVVHRDVKPENIQVLENGHVKLTDFGIARLTFEPNLTMDGQVFGTPSYMSPEQVVGKDIDQRSDLFSAAVVLYEMVTGQKPFKGDSVVSITYAIMNATPEAPPQAPYALQQVLERALDKSPAMRYASATELSAALEGVRQALAHGGAVQGVVSAPTGPALTGPAPFVPTPAPPPILAPPPSYSYTPYAQPAPPPPTAGGPNVSYQPYLPGGAGAAPYAGGYVPPQGGGTYQPTAIPVYYPPPPRQPLLKPETQRFLSRLFLAVVILGSFFALLIVGVQSISNAVERMRTSEQDRTTIQLQVPPDPSAPLDTQIEQREARMAELNSEVARGEEARQIAVLYERNGRQRLANGDVQGAEVSFGEAIRKDPDNPALRTNLAALYAGVAARTRYADDAIPLWQESASYWSQAADLERSSEQALEFRTAAAQALYRSAELQVQSGRAGDARLTLYDARRLSPTGSPTEAAVLRLLQELGG